MDKDRLYLYFAALGAWLILASAAQVWMGSKTIILTLVLLAFTTVALGLTNHFKNAVWIAAILSVLINGVMQFSMAGFSQKSWLEYGISVVALIVTALLSSFTAKQFRIIFGQLDRERNLIEELRAYDPETGLLKWIYARQSLKAEITRSQRFHNDLCLLLIQVEHWDKLEEGFTAGSLKELKIQISDTITRTLRTVDIPFSSGKLGAILPGTRPEGATIAAERLVKNSFRNAHVTVNIGISHFPNDGGTEEEIVLAAEKALIVAVNNDRSIVQSGHISYTLEGDLFPGKGSDDQSA